MANGAMQPRGMPKLVNAAGSGLYAAPHMNKTQGIERPELSRYSKIADDVTGNGWGKHSAIHAKIMAFFVARLLKTSILPEHMKTFTRKEYRNAPNPAAGSASEQYSVDDEMTVCFANISTF